jgi:hypothetical protein
VELGEGVFHCFDELKRAEWFGETAIRDGKHSRFAIRVWALGAQDDMTQSGPHPCTHTPHPDCLDKMIISAIMKKSEVCGVFNKGERY